MADYRFLFCDALTGVLIDELPVDCQSFTQQISAAGTFTGTVPLGAVNSDWRAATEPRRTTLIVLRDGLPVWGGRIMKRRPNDDKTAAEINAETLEGYLSRRAIKTTLTYTAADVFDIARGIIDTLQAVAGGNMNLAYSSRLSGQPATVTYTGTDRTKALDALTKLAEVQPGFEFTVTWALTGSTYTPTLILSAPALAVVYDPILLEFPGNLADYSYDEDGTTAINALTGVGQNIGGTPLLTEQTSTIEVGAGYPIYEGELSLTDESDYTRLAARTLTALDVGLADYVVPTAVLRGDATPSLGEIPLGIACRLRATSLYHPAGVNGRPGLDVYRRITGWSVTPAPPEKVTLSLAASTARILGPAASRTTNRYLQDLHKRLLRVETA